MTFAVRMDSNHRKGRIGERFGKFLKKILSERGFEAEVQENLSKNHIQSFRADFIGFSQKLRNE